MQLPPPRPVAFPLLTTGAPVARVRVSPDARVLACGGGDGRVHLADLELGLPTFTVDLGAPVVDLDLGSTLAVAAVGEQVVVVGAHAGRELRRLAAGAPVVAVALAPDGAQLAAVAGGQVVVWRAATGREVARHPVAGACALAWVGRTGRLRVGTAPGDVLDVDARRGGAAAVAHLGAPVARLAVSHHERRGVHAWALVGGALVGVEPPGAPGARAVDVDALGARVALARGGAGWTAGDHAGPDAAVAVAWHPAGTHLAVATPAGEVGLRPLAS